MIKLNCKVPVEFDDLLNENAGFLYGQKQSLNYIINEIIPCKNLHKDPVNHYYIGKCQYIEATKRAKEKNKKLIGIIHNHTPCHEKYPSQEDIKTIRSFLGIIVYNNSICFYNNKGIIEYQKRKQSILYRIIFNLSKLTYRILEKS